MNKVMLIGNVGQDPEVRYVDQGVVYVWQRRSVVIRFRTEHKCRIIPTGIM